MSRISATVSVNVGNVPGLIARVGQALYNGTEDGTKLIEGSAKEKCPVDTGALRSSIHSEVYRGAQAAQQGGALSSSLFSVVGVIKPEEPYAGYVEFGTGQRGAASPDAGPFPYSPDHKGMVPQPYLRPAADENLEAVVDGIRDAIREELA